MADDITLKNILGDDYKESPESSAVYLNGKLRYFKIDIDQPGKYFFDLTDAFNASIDEGNKIIPIRLMRGGDDIDLNGYTISMDGKYPGEEIPFSVTSSLVTSNPSYIRFNLPLGLFQAVGVYRFQFTFKNASTGEILKSPWQFFNVTQSATNMAIDLSNGIEPFDSEYTAWKAKVEAQINEMQGRINNFGDQVSHFKGLVDNYTKTVTDAVDTAWSNKLTTENTWTSKQHFNGGLTASTVGGNMLQGENLQIDSSASLPSNTTVAVPALKYVSNKLGNGVFAFEQKIDVNTEASKNNTKAAFVNGVGTATGGNHYMSIRVFRYQDCYDNGTWSIVEIHANCNIPDSAKGKPIIQFGDDTHLFEGIDQTPFTLGNWILMFDKNSKTLVANGKINSSGTNDCQDATMV